jgi:hypothetical protein
VAARTAAGTSVATGRGATVVEVVEVDVEVDVVAVDVVVDVVAVDVVVDVSEAGGPLPPEQAPASSTTTMAAPAAEPTLVMCPGVARG